MTRRRLTPSWTETVLVLMTALVLLTLQIFVIWVAFNFLGRAFSWPRIDYWQAGALFVLARAFLSGTSTEKTK